MARRRKPPEEARADRMATYPMWFFEIAEKLAEGDPRPIKDAGAQNLAVNFRHRFHLFRRDLVAERHPHAEAAVNCSISIEGSQLIFTNTGHLAESVERAIAASQHAMVPQSQPHLAPQHFTQRQGTADSEAEELTRKWLKGSLELNTTPSPQAHPAHTCVEWNEYDACVECGRPK